MSWLKKRFSRLRRLAGLKSKSDKAYAAAAPITTISTTAFVPDVSQPGAATQRDDESSGHRDGAVSASQLTLELKRCAADVDNASENALPIDEQTVAVAINDDGTKDDAVNAAILQQPDADDKPRAKSNVMTKLPVKVAKPQAPSPSATLLPADQNNSAGTFTKLATAGERWALQPAAAGGPKRPLHGGKLPRLDRVQPTALDSSEWG